ncbi:MAG: M23 family metallopeptidase [Spirochaetaceae bacterium]|jgi:hypothetical protein|nr:M23 family metallopeptidase [Spirochaetaceae bacterium]
MVIELLKAFPLISLLVTHPLESISDKGYERAETSWSFVEQSYYIAPGKGRIKEIMKVDGLFQVTLSLDDGSEIVFSGLSEIIKQQGDTIDLADRIGTDRTASRNTKYIIMFYENAALFPQFNGKDLTFPVDQGTRASMIADGVIVSQNLVRGNTADGWYTQTENGMPVLESYIPKTAGYYSQIKLTEISAFVTYCHLFALRYGVGTFVRQGDWIVYSGNTGASKTPRLVLHFEDLNLGDDIRVIYFRDSPIYPQ